MGALTSHLAQSQNIQELILIEKDQRFERVLKETIPSATLIMQDALEVDWAAYGPCAIAGNLPYNVSVPIVLKYLSHAHLFTSAVFMFQKEVGDRIMASVGCKSYGRLSVMAQAFVSVKRIVRVSPSAFWPQPAVDSVVLSFAPRQDPCLHPSLFLRLEKIVAAAFAKRRKMIHHAFPGMGITHEIWESMGLSPQMRAEEVPVESYCRIANEGGKAYVVSS